MRGLLQAALLLSFCIVQFTVARAQFEQLPEEEPWSISVRFGISVPTGPDIFSLQYEIGRSFGLGFDYRTTPTSQVGGFIDVNWFDHNGKSLLHQQQEFRCLGGGAMVHTAAGLRIRTDIITGVRATGFITANFGVSYVYRDQVMYAYRGAEPILPSTSDFNMFGSLGLGLELPLTSSMSLGIEAEYRLAETGLAVDQFVPVRSVMRVVL
jgi:hypothetical protein